MKNKKIKSKENENTENIPAFTNFTQYIDEFHKMFNHCKYNLVALNKKFDALEMFFKNYIIKDKISPDYPLSNAFDYETSNKNRVTNRPRQGSNRISNDDFDQDESNIDTKTEKEENFPISIEDLDYLTKNFISEEAHGTNEDRIKSQTRNAQTSSRKKKSQPENVITIKKKDVQLDESLADFFGKNNIEEEAFKELPVQIEKNTENNFVQKLFDYKTFSQSIKKSDIKEKDDALLMSNELAKEGDISRWITKTELDMKSAELNEENFKILSPADLSLSLAENIERNYSKPIYKPDLVDPMNNMKNNMKNVNNPNASNKKLSSKQKFEQKLIRNKEPDQDCLQEDKENDPNEKNSYTSSPDINTIEMLQKKRIRRDDCETCKKIINDDGDDYEKIKCRKCADIENPSESD